MNTGFVRPAVATVLTACGIETAKKSLDNAKNIFAAVATVLTACGIETSNALTYASNARALQQYLPLAVLKPTTLLPQLCSAFVATVLTACGIETSWSF